MLFPPKVPLEVFIIVIVVVDVNVVVFLFGAPIVQSHFSSGPNQQCDTDNDLDV